MSLRAPQPLPRMLAADEIIPTMQHIVADRKAVRDLVSRAVTPEKATFGNVILPWLEDQDLNQGTEAVIDMYRYAGPDQESRDAAEAATRLMSECAAQIAIRQDLFLLVKAVADKKDFPNEECAKAVRDILRYFANVGHGKLSSDQIKTLLDSRKEIDQLRQAFNQNLRENTEGLSFTPAELEGLPTKEVQRLTGKSKDHVFIEFGKRSDRLLVLRHARCPATRKKLFLGNEHKLSENTALFKQIVILRDKNACLLGFKSHAEFKLQERLAPSADWVDDMLNSIHEKLLPVGKAVMEQLKTLKRMDLATNIQPGDEEIFPWDFDYYMRLFEEDEQADQELISEYFPLRNTVLKMLGLFGSFLQLRFLPMKPEEIADRTWHEDVEAWSVWDDRAEHAGEFVGYLFADMLYRNGKYKGNQNVNLQASYLKPNGDRVFPATILMCNFSPSAVTGCAQLRHSEVVTLFHELGHGIHDLLSRTIHTRYHAWRAPAEFSEALSTMLENWCWNKSELKEMSCHYTRLGPDYLQRWIDQNASSSPPPAEHIPDELLDRLIASRNLKKALGLLQQTADAVFDMAVHNPTAPESLLHLDGTRLYNSIQEEFTLIRIPDSSTWGPAHCHFGHLMSGYDAGYFSYLSAQIFAADLYQTAFAANPQYRETWERYRRIVLEPGGSRDGLKMMDEFLGHTPTPDALVQSLRL